MSLRLHDLKEINYEELKKKLFPLILRKDIDLLSEWSDEYSMSDYQYYLYMNEFNSELEDIIKFDLRANRLSDIIEQMDFNIKDMFHVGDESLILTPESTVALLVDKNGELMFMNLNYVEDEVDVYLISDSNLIIKFLDEFIQLLTRTKKDKKKIFDYMNGEDFYD